MNESPRSQALLRLTRLWNCQPNMTPADFNGGLLTEITWHFKPEVARIIQAAHPDPLTARTGGLQNGPTIGPQSSRFGRSRKPGRSGSGRRDECRDAGKCH